MWKEFRAFIMRGSVIDLAVGIIIGGAFGTIVSSLVKDIIMPPIGLLLGKINFADLYINLTGTAYPTLKAAQEASAATINYGLFINNVINFLLIGVALFFVIKAVNKMKRPEPVAAPTTKECPYCLTQVPLKATRCPACTSELI
jgi:large conductance mechanosensitive channel